MNTHHVAFITGASSGIGRATALACARRGINVVGFARRTQRLTELETEINALPAPHGEFLGTSGDVTSADDQQAAIQQTLEHFGRLDILIANAGIGQRGALTESDWTDIETVLRVNIDGVMHSIRAAVPALKQSSSEGHIVIVSSIVFNLVSPYAATYAASKAFVSSLAQSLRMELQPDGIHVSDMRIGRVSTEFNETRLGEGKITGKNVPTMTAEQVAEGILRAIERKQKNVVLRWFDRIMIWGNMLIPNTMGRLAQRQYQ